LGPVADVVFIVAVLRWFHDEEKKQAPDPGDPALGSQGPVARATLARVPECSVAPIGTFTRGIPPRTGY